MSADEHTEQTQEMPVDQALEPQEPNLSAPPAPPPQGNPWIGRIVAGVVICVLIGLGAFYRAPLAAWFGLAPAASGSAPMPSASMADMDMSKPPKPPEQKPPELPKTEYSATRLASLQTALLAYEDLRAALASDAQDQLAGPAKRLEAALNAALQGEELDSRIRKVMETAIGDAQEIQGVDGLEDARKAFGSLSMQLVALIASDERLSKGEHLFKCPMADGYAHWIQPNEQLSNPYMGQKMLTCGSEENLQKHVEPADEHAEHQHAAAPGSNEIAHWTCPMHPSVKQAGPGQCPICGMDLVPVTKAEVESGVIIVDSARRQRIGVKLTTVEKKDLKKQLRAVGRITYDETRIFDVTVKFKGFIQQLFADSTGKRVKKGHALFTIYSPEIYQAEQDLIIAKKSAMDFGGDAGLLGSEATKGMEEAAKQRLRLLDVPRGTVRRVIKSGKPMRYVPIVSPASGYIVEKNVFEGSAVEPGKKLMRIADLDKVWIETELYEAELPLVKVGAPAVVTLPYLPDKKFEGKVSFVYPYLSGSTRTGKVRIELKNRDIELKPDMYANVELSADRGERVVVPVSAVIYAGPRRLVFLDLGEGRLKPQEIKVGIKAGDDYEVLEGLKAGERVVSSGNFLIAAESRLKSAEGHW